MTKFKHFETESGKNIMTSEFDGHNITDRLEGLMFQITVQSDGTLKASVKPEDEDFFSDFNTTKFLKMAIDFAEQNDEFVDPISGEKCWLVVDGIDRQPHTCDSSCNHNQSNTQNIIDQILGTSISESENDESKEPVIGKFKPKRKFLNFVIGKKGGVRYHTDTAFIKGEQLSGTLEDVIFKITICDEGTINFEECDTNQCDDDMIQRFIDDIDSRDVTSYMQKYIVYGIDFQDEDAKKLYLEVDEEKPIDKLSSLFDSLKEEETKKETMEETKISDNALSLIDSLFGETKTEDIPQEEETITQIGSKPQESIAQQMMREAFEEMNREKINELSDRIDKKERDIQQYKSLIRQNESNLKTANEDYRVLQSRLDSLKPNEPDNGYIFYVSPESKTGVVLDQSLQDVVKQISPLLKLKEDAVIDFLTKGFYTIKIAKQGNLNDDNLVLDKEILQKISNIDVTGKISMIGNVEFEYRGEMTWHKLVDKMLKMGFTQDPEFDKMCGSPSYQSEETNDDVSGMKDSIMEMAKNLGIEDIAKQHIESIEEGEDSKFSEKPEGKVWVEYNEPTTLVILGESNPTNPNYIQITDDETSFSLFVGEKMTHEYLGSMGFADIFTLDEYKRYYTNNKEMLLESDLIGGVVVPNFVGKIEVAAFEFNKRVNFSKDFDFSYYIQHQFGSKNPEVGILLPEGTFVVDLNEDYSIPVELIRDIKIDSIVK